MLATDSFLTAELERIVGSDGILRDRTEMLTYESDGLARLHQTPGCVVLPSSAAEVQQIVRLCHQHNVPFVARGHGTGLSGGALPLSDGVLIVLSRLNRIIEELLFLSRADAHVMELKLTIQPPEALHAVDSAATNSEQVS